MERKMEIARLSIDKLGDITRIHIVYAQFGEWITAYLDDTMGTLFIVSDWGSWSHRWGLIGIPNGMTFTEFVLRRAKSGSQDNWHYIADKLHYGRNDRDEWDEKSTKSAILRGMVGGYKDAVSTMGSMRHVRIDSLNQRYREAVETVIGAERFEELYDDRAVNEFYRVDGEDHHTKPSTSFTRLYRFILPAIGEAWLSRQEPVQAVAT